MIRGLAAAACLALLFALPLAAQAQAVKPGAYMGLQYGFDNVGGEFNDTITLATSSEAIDVPRVKGGGGAGVLIGWRTGGGGGFELGWHRSSHGTSSVAFGFGNASFEAVDLDGKYGLYNEGPVRLWGRLGIGFLQMTVDGSRSVAGSRSDARYKGSSINLGVGGAYDITPQWGLMLDLFWRGSRFGTVQGRDIDGGLKAEGVAWRLATTWMF
jgi:opacity protein-like surface antigen